MGRVLLIAGHGTNYNGSYDPGAVSVHGQEAELNRELLYLVRDSIGSAIEADVYDTGRNCYSYSKAGQVPNYAAYDIVMEIHFNAKSKKDESGDGSFTGMGAYVHPNNTSGKQIAEKIIGAVAAIGFKKWLVCDSTGLLNLNNAQNAGTTYFLLETAFVDDGDDMTWYRANKARVAQQIAQVLISEIGGNFAATQPTVSTTTSSATEYTPGMYKINVDSLNIRKGPGLLSKKVGEINDRGTYTIVEIDGSWGRLKSGAGWINCHTSYCTRVSDAGNQVGAEPEDNAKTFEVRVKIKDLWIRKGPGTSYGKVNYCPIGTYNIVETKVADGYTWGKLKSGAGWIALEYTERV